MTSGVLDIRGDAEPAAMAAPTTITGTNDDGQIAGGTLSTPTVSFAQRITDPAVTNVQIDAAFSMVTPNSLRGSIDPDRNVRVTTSVRVDLALRVEILPGQVFRCTASPIPLVLEGHHDGTAVTLRAPNFSVPAVPATDTCPGFIGDGINAQLQGAGHSLVLVMEGDLTAPVAPGEDSITTLTASPAGRARAGSSVTLTAEVVPGAAAINEDPPSGVVEFRDGGVVIGTVETDSDGRAELTTTSLQGGVRVLSAHYLGSSPIYAPSSSTPVELAVVTPPTITIDPPLPPAVVVGTSVDFDVQVRNPDLGASIPNGRLDVIVQPGGSNAIGPVAGTPRIAIARMDGDHEVPIATTHSGTGTNQRIEGSIDPLEGRGYPVGEHRSLRLRLSINPSTPLGSIRLALRFVDLDEGAIVSAERVAVVHLINADRHVTTLAAGQVLPARPAVVPVRTRAGQVIEMTNLRLATTISGLPPRGAFTFSVDGRPVLVRRATATGEDSWVDEAPIPSGTSGITPTLLLPRDLGAGSRSISVSYSGDLNYAPATASFPVMIDPAIGPAYECVHTGTFFGVARAQLDGRAALPAAAAPPSVPVRNTLLSLRMSRGRGTILALQEIPTSSAATISIELSGGGVITAESLTLTNATEMTADQPAAVDLLARLNDLAGAADLAGPPGSVVDVSISRITIEYVTTILGGAVNTLRCTPVAEPFSFGPVEVAGVAIDAPAAVPSGREVVLSAQGFPAGPGTFEFTADGRTIGQVATADGTGRVWTRALTGDADVVATFYPAGPFPAVSSAPHRIRVITTCTPLEDGTGAIVRLVYMELLGRCPDAPGYDHWVGQLDDGLDPTVFAKRISASSEARKVIVADAYRLLLDRAPDPAGATFWAERLGRNARYDDLLASIAGSAEFRRSAGGSDAGVVGRLYERIIGRAPDTAGRDYWTGVLASRGTAHVVRSFVSLPEPLAAIVTGSYRDLLDRAPTVGERDAGVAALRADGDRSALYASIIATEDFATRAQGFPELG